MAEVIAVSPKGKRIEGTKVWAKSHRRAMALSGEDGWQYFNGNEAIPTQTASPVKRVSESHEEPKLKITLEDIHSLIGDLFLKQNEILAELRKNRGGRPPKQKVNAQVDN